MAFPRLGKVASRLLRDDGRGLRRKAFRERTPQSGFAGQLPLSREAFLSLSTCLPSMTERFFLEKLTEHVALHAPNPKTAKERPKPLLSKQCVCRYLRSDFSQLLFIVRTHHVILFLREKSRLTGFVNAGVFRAAVVSFLNPCGPVAADQSHAVTEHILAVFHIGY